MHFDSAPHALRVMTYNVHGCVGMDRQRSETRIADVIGESGADIVGLQEFDLGRRRSAGVDQAGLIAEQLGWHRHFHPAMSHKGEDYGDAILSRFPLTLRQARELPARPSWLCRESRSAIWAEIATPSGGIHVLNTHLGLARRERLTQARLLVGPEWIGSIPSDQPVCLVGDFNSLPNSPPLRVLTASLRDVCLIPDRTVLIRATYPTAFPLVALDHILINERLTALRFFVHRSPLARVASDHFPLLADVTVR